MLLRLQRIQFQHLAFAQICRDRCVFRFLFIGFFHVKRRITLKLYRLTGGAEIISCAFNFRTNHVIDGCGHLARDKALPYKPVKPKLVTGKVIF